MKSKFYIFTIIIITLISGCKPVNEETVPAAAETPVISAPFSAAEVPVTEPEKPKSAEVTLAFAGDNLIHSSIYAQAAQRAGGGGYDFEFAYKNAEDLIKPADIAVINQETLISDLYPPSTYPRFNSPEALGDHMLEMGFDVFMTANNHTIDKGEEGLLACLDYWDSKENAVAAGAYRNAADRNNIRTSEVNGVIFSYLAYTEHLNGLVLPADSDIIIGSALDIALMTSEVEKAKEISDVCIVSLHWGVEDSDVISDIQRNYAKLLAEAGADIIFGHHPHVLRDIELIEREDGSFALCAYSLGNFISAQSRPQNLIGGVLQLKVTVPLDGGEENARHSVISDIKLIPVITHYGKNFSDLRLYKFSDYTRELADAHGVRAGHPSFGYDYIESVLDKNINANWLYIDR